MYLINGELHTDFDLEHALTLLQQTLPQHLNTALDSATVLIAVGNFARQLHSVELPLDQAQRQALIDFCQPHALQNKLERELGNEAESLRRIDYRQSRFERWSPLGLVVHVTPANAPLLACCAVIESLLAGNINWLRPSRSDQGLTARLLHTLLQCDPSAQLRHYVAVLPVATAQIGRLCKMANGVSAWGGVAALQAIRQQLPPGCRWIDWGHRVSFAYLTAEAASPQALDAIVDEVCRLDQQACSSPQWLLVDSNEPAVLETIGAALAEAFERRSGQWPALLPNVQEASEITTQCQMANLGKSFSAKTAQVWSAPGWRVIWSHDQRLAPSPLFRTLLLKPLPRARLVQTLLPWRNVLQSCALVCADSQIAELSRTLIAAGVSRITPINAIHHGYDGEPHDGVYALQRLSRRVSVSVSATQLPTHMTLDRTACPLTLESLPITDKAAFIARPTTAAAQLFFRSSGSSGTPALAGFSYRDFHRQMQATADGLFAAGLDPSRDKVMNLFITGSLCGSFFSFAKVLELLGATHLPMGAPSDDDYSDIAQLIIEQRVTVLIGMPSIVHRLFLNEQSRLSRYGAIEKVFLGGEHISDQCRELLQRCGVTQIRSAVYGSVDAGVLGHACAATGDGVFHLLDAIQHLEIVALEQDVPVVDDEVGRLLFTSKKREGQQVQRYEVGDTGRWLPGQCACGLDSPRFELLQRHGSLLRVGSDFICLNELGRHLQAPFQLHLDHAPDGLERLLIRSPGEPADILDRLQGYSRLANLERTALVTVHAQTCEPLKFEKNRHSQKMPRVIDARHRAQHSPRPEQLKSTP